MTVALDRPQRKSGTKSSSQADATKPTNGSATIPVLEVGDRLTRAEFEHRYHAMPNVKKAERIEGVVYMPSPVRQKQHSRPHSQIVTWLGTYYAATPYLDLGDNATVRMDIDNDPQPDALLRLEPDVGGTSAIADDDYIEGAPELIVEIAASTESYDLHDKKNTYRRNGVKEYIVWRTRDQVIDWFVLNDGQYEQLTGDDKGVLHSQAFPGLYLNTTALLNSDMKTVLSTLQVGIASPEHAAFVEQLSSSSSSTEEKLQD